MFDSSVFLLLVDGDPLNSGVAMVVLRGGKVWMVDHGAWYHGFTGDLSGATGENRKSNTFISK